MNVINFNELENLYQGNTDFQQEILVNFIERMPIYFDCLRDSLMRRNSEELQDYSCQLRAVSRRCCINEVHHLCEILEMQAETQEFSHATRTLRKIQDLFAHIQDVYPLGVIH